MSLRRVLNVAWAVVIDGLDPEGVAKLRAVINANPKTAAEQAEEERKRKAQENKASISGLSQAFALGK